ncbi:hypothetical protein PybrP1_008933, partial [[Pythium] brassicae (nom. inval.)]
SSLAQLQLNAANVTIAPKGDFQLFAALSTEAPPSAMYPYTNRHSTFLPPRFIAAGIVGTKAIPTNNWWGNMIAFTTEAQVQPAWVNPYTVRPQIVQAPFGLTVSYAYPSRAYGGSTGNGNANRFYLHGALSDFTFSAAEFTTVPAFEVFGWDDLSVQLRFAKGSGKFESTLVSGMAFATSKYTALTPSFSTIYAITRINGQNTVAGQVIANTRFVLEFNNGQTWTLYFSSSVSLRVDSVSMLTATAAYTGTARVAMTTSAATQVQADNTRNCILEGGDVEARDESSYSYNWKTSGNCASGLLHYAQIHHVDTLDRTSAAEAAGVEAFSTTRGKMTGLLTKTSPPVWRFTDTQSIPVDFYPPRKPAASVVAAQRIKETLTTDIRAAWSIPLDGSYYFNGKAAQKYASLCLLAADSSVVGTDTALRTECMTKLKNILLPFVDNTWTNKLNYDTVYRGILSSEGFTKNDANVDFGNTMYNDHHYHFGYWIVTAAIVNHLEPTWSRIADLNRMTSFLIRDVANPSWSDPHFPKFRNFDWYRGHSYSHGVTPFADGKDQESTSEDVNFHYGLALFGQVTNNAELTRIGRLMLKLDVRAVKTYFLMTTANVAQPAQILPNKVTGIMFDNKIDYATWFSAEKYAIHGIQMIPISPVTEFVRSRQFVDEEWSTVLSREPIIVNNDLANAWSSLLYANYATVNKDVAMSKLQTATMDDGLTRSWALYMAATRP